MGPVTTEAFKSEREAEGSEGGGEGPRREWAESHSDSGLEDGGRGPRNVGNLWKLEKQGSEFSARTSERMVALLTP